MKGTVEKIEEKHAKNGQKYLLLAIDGQNYSLWDGKAFERVHEGDAVEYKWKAAGDYRNITEIDPVNGSPDDGLGSRDEHILRMSCLKSASAIFGNLGVEPDERVKITISAARRFEKYIRDDEG
jgi:hypothetical protein